MNRTLRARTIAGVAGPLAFVASWVVAGTLREGYDPVNDAISRLAELDAPNRWIVSTGMLTFGGACLLFAPLLERPARYSLRAAGAASLGVAAFPCSEGCPGPTTITDIGHSVFATINYVAFALTPFLHRGRTRDRAIAVFAGAALLAHGIGIEPNGLLQRLGLTTLDLWLAATAAQMLKENRLDRATT